MTNLINYTISMRIKDDENWPQRDEYENRSVSGIVRLDDGTPTRQILDIGRCGGEVRVEARFTLTRAAGGAVRVNGDLRLYEGTSTNSNDLDGRASITGTVAAGGRQSFSQRVRNTDEGGDWADVTLRIDNAALSSSDPCAHIDAKAAELGSAFTGNAVSGCETVRGGHRKRFHGCDIYYSPSTGAHEVHGDIRRKYNALGGPDSDLRLPVTDETKTPDRVGRYNHFSGNGSIYWHPRTGPMEVRGGIRGAWAAQGWERGGLGYPTSDEMRIRQSPAQWFSDFQNGVLFWQERAAIDPATASLPRNRVLAAFDAAFRSRVTDLRVDIQSVSIVNVSSTSYDFRRSGNRVITFRIAGEVSSGRWYVPDPDWWVELPILFQGTPHPNAANDVELRVRRAGAPRVHVSNFAGIGVQETMDGLRTALDEGFASPITLAEIPAAAGLLSAKVMPDGAISLYFRPDNFGRFAAAVAQDRLDNIEI